MGSMSLRGLPLSLSPTTPVCLPDLALEGLTMPGTFLLTFSGSSLLANVLSLFPSLLG